MAEEKVSFAEVIRGRAWWLAPEELKARAKARPNSRTTARTRTITCCTSMRRPRGGSISRGGRNRGLGQGSKAAVCPRRQECLVQAQTGKHVSGEVRRRIAEEAECTLLELVEAGLPEWVEQGTAEDITPSEFQGPVAVLQEVPPEYLDDQGQFVDPGWQQIEEQLRRALRPDKLQALQVEIASCQLFIRVFLARRAVIDVFSQELGLDLVIHPVRHREQAIGDLLAIYNQQAARSWESDPDEDGFVPPDEVLPFPSDLRLPLIDVGKLEPDPADVELMRQSLGTPLVDDWWQAAHELGICGALGDGSRP